MRSGTGSFLSRRKCPGSAAHSRTLHQTRGRVSPEQPRTAELIVSGLAAAEFSSAIARRVRMLEFSRGEAEIALAGFDAWLAQMPTRMEIAAADIVLATTYLRRFDLALRTPDALHLAIARRLGATLVTFDRAMAAAARALGMAVVLP
ncbi:MAG TPA: type II toxin-antitoxin system VapC family toxin [Stellaceae bacterium]|nr:type II toxin-antitoxin system VapC family toxin [Stellaceae bacterium]